MRLVDILALGLLVLPAAAQTSSPFAPPAEKLGTYVINAGGGLDTGCTFRSGGPLVVRLRVPAPFNSNQLNADGTLKDPAKLTGKGILGPNANVRFPVFDIDSSAVTSGFSPERDNVSFNGRQVKVLTGFNNTWTDDSLSVPIGEVRFASDVSPNAVNELRVDIDQANIGIGEYWCMAIDWVAIEFQAAAPYALLHGIAASETTWNDDSSPGVLAAMNEYGVLYRAFRSGKHGSVADNAADLQNQINAWLGSIKSDRLHIIAHSKGGLDAQMLQALGPPFKILSLSTFSTPHLGSVTADVAAIRRSNAEEKLESGTDPGGLVSEYLKSTAIGIILRSDDAPQPPGVDDLTTFAATTALGAGQRGNVAKTFSIGANADVNGNNALEDGEIDPFPIFKDSYRLSWRIIRDVVSVVTVSTRTLSGRLWGTRTTLEYRTTPGGPFPNDIWVSVQSANPPYPNATVIQSAFGGNHATVKNPGLVRQVMDRTIPIQ